MGLVNSLQRHYLWIAVAQLRKVLGGAGPAIAAIPASVLWAGISLVDLTRDVASNRVRAASVMPRLGFVAFTSMGQVRLLSPPPHFCPHLILTDPLPPFATTLAACKHRK